MIFSFKLKKRCEDWIVFLFGILPIVDCLNGIMRNFPIAAVYKVFLCAVLAINIFRASGRMKKRYTVILMFSVLYILASIFINTQFFHGKLINTAYPVKLIFNIVLLFLLLENLRKKFLHAEALYRILDMSSWWMIVCYLTPYVLGLGNEVYSGGLGFKSFFIAQNELNLIIVVMVFFMAYKLMLRFQFIDFIKMTLLILCGILLNTKTTIIACLLALAIWFCSVMIKKDTKVKIITIVSAIIGAVLLRDKLIRAISGSLQRFTALQTNYYGGSVLTSILSGRNYYAEHAWDYFNSEHTLFRFFFGNGFCSNYLTEMDLVDIFFYLGSIGAVASICFLGWVLKKSVHNMRTDKTIIRPVSFVVIIALLAMSGHVLFMAMSGCYFVVYVCFLIYYKNDASIYER